MNLNKLFDMQRVLDERIVREKGLEGRDLLPEKILALQVELGELANEGRSWKFWSEDRKPRTTVTSKNTKCDECALNNPDGNPLLEEYVDCLHFILSIGLEIQMEEVKPFAFKYESIIAQFNELFADVAMSYKAIGVWSVGDTENNYQDILCGFIGLGEMLGFTWEQIETAYYEKNAINHERQCNGY